MHILNVMQCTQMGGTEQASLRLMRGLKARGHRVSVLSLNTLGALAGPLAEVGIPAEGVVYRGRLGWRSLPEIRRRIHASGADALIMTGHNMLAMLALGRVARGRRMLAMHYHHSERADWQWRLFYFAAERSFNAITYPSDFVRFEAEAIMPRIAGRARTLRNPLATPPLFSAADRAASRARLGLPAGVPLIGNAGWLIRRKRFDVFLRTAAEIARELPEARFLIAGEGEEHAALAALADGVGIGDRVHWLGWLGDLTDFYLSLDLLLFNSDWDALGNTPLEALTFGVPVVASVVNGGLSEFIPDRRYGWLMAEHDHTALAAACLEAIGPAGGKTAERARHRVLAMSDPDTIAAEVEALLEQPAHRSLRPGSVLPPGFVPGSGPAPARRARRV